MSLILFVYHKTEDYATVRFIIHLSICCLLSPYFRLCWHKAESPIMVNMPCHPVLSYTTHRNLRKGVIYNPFIGVYQSLEKNPPTKEIKIKKVLKTGVAKDDGRKCHHRREIMEVMA